MGQGVVTAGQLEEVWHGTLRVRAPGNSVEEHKRRLLDELIRTEAAVQEARRRGYDRDPQIVRAGKQQLVAKLMREEIDAKVTAQAIPEADIERYYREHPLEFQRPEAVRVSAIFLPDEAAARKVLGLARAGRNKKNPLEEQRAFRDLVARHSQDEVSKARGGDLAFFDRENKTHPPELVAAALAIDEVGELAGPVKTGKGYAIVKLTQKRPGFHRPLADAAPAIRQRLLHELRNKRTVALMETLHKNTQVQIDEKALARLPLGIKPPPPPDDFARPRFTNDPRLPPAK